MCSRKRRFICEKDLIPSEKDMSIRGPPTKSKIGRDVRIECRAMGDNTFSNHIIWLKEGSSHDGQQISEINITREIETGELRHRIEEEIGHAYLKSVLTIRLLGVNDTGTYTCRLSEDYFARYHLIVDPQVPPCPENWTTSTTSGTCLRLSATDDMRSWGDSRRACIKDGADLVKIVNSDMDKLVHDIIVKTSLTNNQTTQPYWIGLNNYNKDGTFRWLNETEEPIYLNWFDGRPDDKQAGDDCVLRLYITETEYRWMDYQCTQKSLFICEKQLFSTPREELCAFDDFVCDVRKCISGQLVCDGHSDCQDSSDENRCDLYVKGPEIKSIAGEDGSIKCRSTGQKTSSKHIHWFKEVSGQNVQERSEVNITGELESGGGQTRYSIQEEIGETFFTSVLTIRGLDMNDAGTYTCRLSNKFYASYSLLVDAPVRKRCTQDQFQCDDGACISQLLECDGKTNCRDNSDENQCDVTIHGPIVTPKVGQEGKLKCQSLGEKTQSKHIDWYRQISRGDNQQEGDVEFMPEINALDNQTYYHVKEETEIYDKNSYFVSVLTIRKVEVKDAGIYTCRLSNKLSASYKLDVDPLIHPCPKNWKLSKTSATCLKLSSIKRIWEDSRAACIADGADLVKIDNAVMNKFIHSLISHPSLSENQRRQPYWIGLHDHSEEGTFRWLNENEVAPYVNWFGDEPNNKQPGQDCGIINHKAANNTQKWMDYYCKKPRKFICEKATLFHIPDKDRCPDTLQCDDVASCIKTRTDFVCQCNDGFHGSGERCEDIDECHNENGSPSGICSRKANTNCVNGIGTFDCVCNSGYARFDSDDCEDIDECEADDACGTDIKSICTNGPGNFTCSCQTGYKWIQHTRECRDIDECDEMRRPNSYHRCKPSTTRCVNSPGSFVCDCIDGFTRRNWYSCIDIDECRVGDINQNVCGHNCGANSVCKNHEGYYECRCNYGYAHTNNNLTCEAFDICKRYPYLCGSDGVCVSEIGDYRCECRDGYRNKDKHSCEDIDECTTRDEIFRHRCTGPGVKCKNTPTSYNCECQQYYQKVDRFRCEEHDCVKLYKCHSLMGFNLTGEGVLPNLTIEAWTSACRDTRAMYEECWNKHVPHCLDYNNRERLLSIKEDKTITHLCSENVIARMGRCASISVLLRECLQKFPVILGLPCQSIEKYHDCAVKKVNQNCGKEVGQMVEYLLKMRSTIDYNNVCNYFLGASLSTFSVIKEELEVKEGGTVDLSCKIENEGIEEVMWVRGSPLSVLGREHQLFSEDPNLSIKTEIGLALRTLTIGKARYSDAGNYYCLLNSRPLTYKTFLLKVVDTPESYVEHESNATVRNVSVLAGEDVILPCKFSNISEGKVIWVRESPYNVLGINDQVVLTEQRISVEERNSTEWNLVFRRVEFTDAGLYSCIHSGNQTKINKFQLFVSDANGQLSSHHPRWLNSPHITEDLWVGESLDLPCVTQDQGTREVIWLREHPFSLVPFKKVEWTDGGTYHCLMNIDPLNISTVHINVKEPGNRVLVSKIAKGSDASLKCTTRNCKNCPRRWSKNPKRPVLLFKGLTPVEANDRMGIDDTEYSLIIRDVRLEDEGYYFCNITSPYAKKRVWYLSLENPCLTGTNNCGNNTNCINLRGSYRCDCKPQNRHSTPAGHKCRAIDHCLNKHCPRQSTCVNLFDRARCQCNTGYAGRDCRDVDECRTLKCGTNSRCVNMDGSYRCDCHDGYYHFNKSHCIDIPECSNMNQQCGHTCGEGTTCQELPGTYRCKCLPQYRRIDEFTCKDLDECRPESVGSPGNNCSRNTVCRNVPQTYLCDCLTGYSRLNDFECVDINECKVSNGPNAHRCLVDEVCYNTDGGYHCKCQEGALIEVDGNRCIDIDECGNLYGPYTHKCIVKEACENYAGSYRCNCSVSGYQLLQSSETRCTDVDECRHGYPCGHYAACENLVGSYRCNCRIPGVMTVPGDERRCQVPCPDGWRGEFGAGTCIKIIEEKNYIGAAEYRCLREEAVLAENSDSMIRLLKEMLPSYNEHIFWISRRGKKSESFELQNGPKKGMWIHHAKPMEDWSLHCLKITNTPNAGNCAYYGYPICEKYPGIPSTRLDYSVPRGDKSYRRKIVNGRRGCTCVGANPDLCYDPVECKEDPEVEQWWPEPTCSYWKSLCFEGYERDENVKDRFHCKDIDECKGSNGNPAVHRCGKENLCSNRVGSYRCTCFGNKYELVDRERECRVLEHCKNCGDNTICNVRPGRLGCSCRGGEIDRCYDQHHCVPNALMEEDCDNNHACQIGECACKPGFMKKPGHGPKYECEDINECSTNNGGCQIRSSYCVNIIGSHRCDCDYGCSRVSETECSCPDYAFYDGLHPARECMKSWCSDEYRNSKWPPSEFCNKALEMRDCVSRSFERLCHRRRGYHTGTRFRALKRTFRGFTDYYTRVKEQCSINIVKPVRTGLSEYERRLQKKRDKYYEECRKRRRDYMFSLPGSKCTTLMGGSVEEWEP